MNQQGEVTTLYDAFKERYELELLTATTNREAYEKAADYFQAVLKFRPYTYDSWNVVRSRKKSNK